MTDILSFVSDHLDQLPEELRPMAEKHLAHLLETAQPTLQQAAACESGRQALSSLVPVVACSDFIARTLARFPELLACLCGPGGISQPRERGEITESIIQFVSTNDQETLTQQLRQVRQQEIARIGWRDLAGLAPLEEVVATLSELADAAIGVALTCAHRELVTRHGEPIGKQSGQPLQMTVLGLGKLGGRELNLSSDIDLVFAYSEAGDTCGPQPISNHEFFLKVGQRLIALLEAQTADGIVFRTDMRLRPNGDSGPLALSFDAIDHYYLTHGRDWERYALIKARPVAGDIAAGERLLTNLKPFVYRKYLDFGAFEAIRSMKSLIERQLLRRDRVNDVKLGRGGIREIEFIVQAHQLIHGGRNPDLQTPSIWQALVQLESAEILKHADCELLRSNYDFLRRLEHRLQAVDDRQTHAVPSDPLDRARIVLALGYHTDVEFSARLRMVTDAVHAGFREVLRQSAEVEEAGGPESELTDLWHGTLATDDANTTLAALGFTEPEHIARVLVGMHNSRFYQAFSREGRERLDRLMPLALRTCSRESRPDIALTRLVSVVEAIGRRSAYLSLLAENPLALEQLVRLITASNWISNWIGQHPVILDELLDPISSFRLQERRAINGELGRRLGQVDGQDLEVAMDLLREYRQGYSLRVAAADVAGLLEVEAVSRALCALAEAVLDQALVLSRSGLTLAAPASGEEDIGIVAYGKLGSLELGYNSDLDIVFVYDQPQGESASSAAHRRHYFGRLVQRLVHILTIRTQAGTLYQIDMRLRPSGRSGTVVSPLNAYQDYLQGNAWTWEHQALVRARMVTGHKSLVERFEAIRRRILCRPRNDRALRSAVADMRQRMIDAHSAPASDLFDLKQGRGGLVDIEFLCQYLVLRWASDDPTLANQRSNASILAQLADSGRIEPGDAQTLTRILQHYLARENALKLQEEPPLIAAAACQSERHEVCRLWQHYLGDTRALD
jgi:glutamate-ammonia-ligase adenylyltransferase